jgi:hypothetical protein
VGEVGGVGVGGGVARGQFNWNSTRILESTEVAACFAFLNQRHQIPYKKWGGRREIARQIAPLADFAIEFCFKEALYFSQNCMYEVGTFFVKLLESYMKKTCTWYEYIIHCWHLKI